MSFFLLPPVPKLFLLKNISRLNYSRVSNKENFFKSFLFLRLMLCSWMLGKVNNNIRTTTPPPPHTHTQRKLWLRRLLLLLFRKWYWSAPHWTGGETPNRRFILATDKRGQRTLKLIKPTAATGSFWSWGFKSFIFYFLCCFKTVRLTFFISECHVQE